MPNGVARDELAYWETFLGKTKIALDDARFQGYGLLGSTALTTIAREREVLTAQLGLSAPAAAVLSIQDLRFRYYSQQLGNPVGKAVDDLAASFWATSGFAPVFEFSFQDNKQEITAAAQTKTVANLNLGANGNPTRQIIAVISFTATAQPTQPTLGGNGPNNYNIANNGAGRYVAIATYQINSGATANFLIDAGVGQTVQDVNVTTYRVNKSLTTLANSGATSPIGNTNLQVGLTGSGWKLGDFIIVGVLTETANITDMIGDVAGFSYDINFGVGAIKKIATGSQLMIPNNNPYNVSCPLQAGSTAVSVACAVRIRVS